MKKLIITFLLLASVVLSACTAMYGSKENMMMRSVKVTITNVTPNAYLTPIMIVGHGMLETGMFTFGKVASEQLQAVAEGGNIAPIAMSFENAQVIENPANGLLGPGESVSVELDSSNTRMSIIAMILPTNDGFVALDNILIRDGIQELYAIDAGTEANDEQITGGGAPNTPGIPADPSGQANLSASGITGVSIEGSIDRHPGIMGGEGSALDQEKHAWKGPVAIVEITR